MAGAHLTGVGAAGRAGHQPGPVERLGAEPAGGRALGGQGGQQLAHQHVAAAAQPGTAVRGQHAGQTGVGGSAGGHVGAPVVGAAAQHLALLIHGAKELEDGQVEEKLLVEMRAQLPVKISGEGQQVVGPPGEGEALASHGVHQACRHVRG